MNSQKQDIIRSLIVDDETLGRDVIAQMLSKHGDMEVIAEASNGEEALRRIAEKNPDLIFLDIKMPGISGIDLAESLQNRNDANIVFVTAYDEYAVTAFEKSALDYLLKPFDQERFDQMLNRVRKRFNQQNEAHLGRNLKAFLQNNSNFQSRVPTHRIVIKESGRVFFVESDEVDHFEASGNYVALHTHGKQHLVHGTLTQMEQKLDPEKFLRIHRSAIVNIDSIRELQPHFNGEYVVLLKNGSRLKVSRSFKDSVKAQLGIE